MEYLVREEELNAVLTYLATRPWQEVNHLIAGLHQAVPVKPVLLNAEQATEQAPAQAPAEV